MIHHESFMRGVNTERASIERAVLRALDTELLTLQSSAAFNLKEPGSYPVAELTYMEGKARGVLFAAWMADMVSNATWEFLVDLLADWRKVAVQATRDWNEEVAP